MAGPFLGGGCLMGAPGAQLTAAPPLPDLPGAACIGSDPDLFISPDDDLPGTKRSARAAKEICRCCPEETRVACLTYAVTHGPVLGVWAGTTKYERDRLAKEDRAAIEERAKHP